MNEEVTIDFRYLMQIIKKRILVIMVITLLSTAASAVLSFYVIKPVYEAEVSVVIGRDNHGKMDGTLNDNDVYMFQQLMKTYAEIARSNTVAEESASKIGGKVTAEYLSKHITVTPQQSTQILNIKASANDAKETYNIISSVSDSFISTAIKFTPGANIQLLNKPKLPTKPVKPDKRLNIAIAFFIGLLISIILAYILEYMDDTIKEEHDVEKYLKLPVIGTIPRNTDGE
ncbi:Wzz/FepE/Etk N-terminal domain-containing protein [Clostridium sp. JN-9]|uniref:YveK family protein n=1 Tax=Clostridium sp. JN-9 TaxID=2507159 RepID=UPI000FFDF7DE|nr:Wzz/FepE/Etk N-terminal domain-containing protein [Clostridium sp. JN-9]QAT40512.1 capsular biosynthesis protein [Clostridium sp. JN-9]